MGWGLISSGSSPIPPSFSSPTKPSSESWAVGETVETFSVRQKDRVCMCCVKSSSTHSTESCAYHAPSHLPPLSVPPFFAQLSGPYELGSHSLCVLLCLCQFVCVKVPQPTKKKYSLTFSQSWWVFTFGSISPLPPRSP